MIKYGLDFRHTSKVYVISMRSTINVVLHTLKICFKVFQTVPKRKQNKEIRKVDLDRCHLAFALY